MNYFRDVAGCRDDSRTKKYFEPTIFWLLLYHQNDGAIAQLVEQRTENPCVPGSIPGGTTKEKPFLNRSGFFCS